MTPPRATALLHLGMWVLLVCNGAMMPLVAAQDQTRFLAPGTLVQESDPTTGAAQRQYTATVYYSDELGMGGREALRLETDLSGTIGITHSDLRVFEDQFLRYTWCSSSPQDCGWEDIFPDTLPPMWCPSSGVGGTTPASQDVGGISASELIEFATTTNRGTVLTWCRTSTNAVVGVFEPQEDVNVLYLFPDGGVDTSPGAFNDSAVFDVPAFCPVVDPSCFRLDLVLVLDHSGSIGESWSLIVDFAADLIDQLSVSDQQFKVAVARYFGGSSCSGGNVGNYTRFVSELTTDKDALLQILASDSLRQLVPPCNGPCPGGSCNTATVKGITLAMDELNSARARVATNKAMIVITDGRGNSPASPLSGGRSITDLDFPPNEWVYDVDDCGSCGGCDSTCRADRHDDWLCVAYRQKWNVTQPTVYAVGVPPAPPTPAICGGSGPDCGTLNRIALNDGGDCPGWWPDAGGSLDTSSTHERATLVATYDALGEVTFNLAEALTCTNPGATPCPNDCRPGGFCCGGVCVCIDNCTLSHPGDSCQTGICASTEAGTQCVAVGSPCSGSQDNTGIIVGSVLGGLVACACLLCLLALVAVIAALLYVKSVRDIQAWEDAFANDQGVQQSAIYEDKGTDMTSAIYEGLQDEGVV